MWKTRTMCIVQKMCDGRAETLKGVEDAEGAEDEDGAPGAEGV